jgi:2-phosphosulfolactate phosphatase
VLSFSTAVDVAISRGAVVYPFLTTKIEPAQAADRVGAVRALPRRAAGAQPSLSTANLVAIPEGANVIFFAPTGSRLSLAGGDTPVLTGCLRNAPAVAQNARLIAGESDIAMVPWGEGSPDGSLRPAIEDLLGAGAIIHRFGLPCSPESRVARDAYRAANIAVAALIRASVSGRELIDGGFLEDVEIAPEESVSARSAGPYRAA